MRHDASSLYSKRHDTDLPPLTVLPLRPRPPDTLHAFTANSNRKHSIIAPRTRHAPTHHSRQRRGSIKQTRLRRWLW
jgi:hypothetical protein